MTRVLFAWELGAAFGHLAHLRVIGTELHRRGIDCEFAVRDLDGAGAMLDAALGPLHQAPLSLLPPTRPLQVQTSYASLLYQSGWSEPRGLAARLRAWRTLIARSGATRLIADHAPTALLAARTLGLPAAAIGTGFTLPPVRAPYPAFNAAEPGLLEANEAAVLGIANQALTSLGTASLPSLQAIFEGVVPGLFTYPELDPYAPREQGAYLGLPDLARGDAVSWGDRREPRIVGYLRPFAALPALAAALASLPVQVLLRVAEVDPSAFAAYLRPGFVVVDHDVDLRRALRDCDLCISNGQHGTAIETLLAGKPALLLPEHREHEINAEGVTRLGAGRMLVAALPTPAETFRETLEDLLGQPNYTAAAEAFAARYRPLSRGDAVARWCEAVIGPAGS